MTSKFNYLVSFYFGPRGNENYNARLKDNKFFFAEKHIDFLKNYSKNNIDALYRSRNYVEIDNPYYSNFIFIIIFLFSEKTLKYFLAVQILI